MFVPRARFARSLLALVAACVVLAATGVAAAQEAYVVELKDGSIYQGDLVEYVPGDHVTLHLATGDARRFAWNEVAESRRAPAKTASATDSPTSTAAPAARPAGGDEGVGPRAGAWSLDLRIPISFAVSSPDLSMNTMGIELGLGSRVSERWYVGGVAGWEMGIDLRSAGMFQMLREGVETRYIFNKGTASVSTDGDAGPYFPVDRYDWIAVRAGAESIGSRRPKGAFAELGIGTDAWLSTGFQLGVVFAAGISLEPANSYAVATGISSPAPSSRIVNPYVTIAFHFGLFG